MAHGNFGDKVGVVLFQLGGPDSPEAVEAFLYNLFCDPDIIDFPFARLARPTMARLIASRRAKKVRAHYASIGGKSPIRELTERQAAALEIELRKTLDARVLVAMRYWRPLTEEAVRAVEASQVRELVLLPLYPQYSRTTTGSSLNEWHRQFAAKATRPLPAKVVRAFYDSPLYIEAVVENIEEGLRRFAGSDFDIPTGSKESVPADRFPARAEVPREGSWHGIPRARPDPLHAAKASDVHLVFSAHGVPTSVIDAGDPYQAQIEATVRLVMERGGWRNPHVLCYQSRVAPGRWLEPSLRETLGSLAERGAKKLLVIPISFVSDHVETLSEIDIEARQLAASLGIEQFELMPALNASPTFIRALADLVLREVGAKSSTRDQRCPAEASSL